MANYLLSGAAGFIAFRVAELLADSGHQVYGVDNLNDAYDIRLKEYRLKRLADRPNFHFLKADISDRATIETLQTWLA
jgi:UDP-glucuronate 4-epimerase